MDKIVEIGLELGPGRAGPVPLALGCDIHYECRVVGRTRLLPEGLEGGIRSRYYRQGDFHTLFFGEILAAWCKAPLGQFSGDPAPLLQGAPEGTGAFEF